MGENKKFVKEAPIRQPQRKAQKKCLIEYSSLEIGGGGGAKLAMMMAYTTACCHAHLWTNTTQLTNNDCGILC